MTLHGCKINNLHVNIVCFFCVLIQARNYCISILFLLVWTLRQVCLRKDQLMNISGARVCWFTRDEDGFVLFHVGCNKLSHY